jgi:hypothetical protein
VGPDYQNHKCYRIEQMVRRKVSKREIKHEVKTEASHSRS